MLNRNAEKDTLRVLFSLVLIGFGFSGLASGAEIMPLDQLRAGMKAEAITVLVGTETETIQIEILGVLDGFIGPDLPLILGRFTGEKGKWQGVAAGMSGSPVTVDGKLIGALSYSIGSFTKEPICGITPIETMLEFEDYPARTLPWLPGDPSAAGLQPVPLSLGIRGLSRSELPIYGDIFASLGDQVSIEVVPVPSRRAELTADDLTPGKPVTALLVWGASEIGATGTVTWREEDRILAFGHPFIGTGRTEFPLAPAETVWTIASDASSFKISRFGNPVGTLTQDRATGIGGIVGRVPEGVPVRVRVQRPGIPPLELEYFLARDPVFAPALSNFVLRNALISSVGAELDQALKLRGHALLADGREIPIVASGAGGVAGPPERTLGVSLVRALSALFQAPMEIPRVESVELEVSASPRTGPMKILRAMPDRMVVRPGESLSVLVEYLGARGERLTKTLELPVPEKLLAGKYTLFAGSELALAREFGSLRVARQRSARTADEYLDALSQTPSDTTLALNLALEAEGVVSRGREFPALPGTAHILLRSRPGGKELFRSRWLTVAQETIELPRTLDGLAKATITISESAP